LLLGYYIVMTIYSAHTIASWERFYRANFINSLTGFKPVSLIGTVNSEGIPNLAIFSSIVHIGSDPALVGFINRPVQAAPHTMANIRDTGSYTINHIHAGILEKSHQTSAKYGEGVNEFTETGLHEQFQEGIQAPFVAESKVKYALSLQEIIPITINHTFLVIGKVELVILSDNITGKDGFLSLEQENSLCSNGTDAYYKTLPVGRLAYAKPGKLIEYIRSEEV